MSASHFATLRFGLRDSVLIFILDIIAQSLEHHRSTNRFARHQTFMFRWGNSNMGTRKRTVSNLKAMGYFSALTKHITLESRGVLSLSPKDSWLPNTADAVQYDIYESQLISKTWVDSFLAAVMWVDSPAYPYQTTNASLSWDLDSTLVKTTVGESPDL